MKITKEVTNGPSNLKPEKPQRDLETAMMVTSAG